MSNSQYRSPLTILFADQWKKKKLALFILICDPFRHSAKKLRPGRLFLSFEQPGMRQNEGIACYYMTFFTPPRWCRLLFFWRHCHVTAHTLYKLFVTFLWHFLSLGFSEDFLRTIPRKISSKYPSNLGEITSWYMKTNKVERVQHRLAALAYRFQCYCAGKWSKEDTSWNI